MRIARESLRYFVTIAHRRVGPLWIQFAILLALAGALDVECVMNGMPMMLGSMHWPTHAMPLMVAILCLMAIAYRYYSAFSAAKVAALDDSRQTPAFRFEDGQNYDPTNKWVLFGHH